MNIISQYKKAPFYTRIVQFGCENCGRRWKSASGSLVDFQICKGCYGQVYPGGYKWEAPNKRGNQNKETYLPHDTELCGKCIRLGYSCMEAINSMQDQEDTIIVNNTEGEVMTLSKSTDIFDNIVTKIDKKKKRQNKQAKKAEREKAKQAWIQLMDNREEDIVYQVEQLHIAKDESDNNNEPLQTTKDESNGSNEQSIQTKDEQ
ncbi:uncharacterized protein B0P05DRAFT_36060 [Gilbertella persicaria]|uniref:uncharacterized protein n=1 Tax=Gilbertella persicaria TaxID=101096 RepID=UPI00221F2F5E|nr:uncharacterized protein B0P05DRAFT_36060 [Gilbertella persicaria]KAI8084357.1 hypothetical protein B0P05DRAFT_36060 [Gilbertella persicaria]